MELRVRNVNQALGMGVSIMSSGLAVPVSPRGSPTLEWPDPVVTHYSSPIERVLFSPTRDANPFFHFFEALWMLAGRNDVEFIAHLLPRMKEFSDDGISLGGAYGYRWRRMWYDQLNTIIHQLRQDPSSRRAVLAMWSPMEYVVQGPKAKDLPCNTHVYFKIRNDKLNMTVSCRSNDMLWGAYGANAVHFSMLMEYMADKIGDLELGRMTQISDSFHVYTAGPGGELWDRVKVDSNPAEHDRYSQEKATIWPMDASGVEWDRDLYTFFRTWDEKRQPVAYSFETEYFRKLVLPMWWTYATRDKSILEDLLPLDWAVAGTEWLERRQK